MRRSLLAIALGASVSIFASSASAKRAGDSMHSQFDTDKKGTQDADDELGPHPLHVDLDVVVGFGNSDVAKQATVVTGNHPTAQAVLVHTNVFVESFLLSLRYDLGDRAAAFARMPLTFMSFKPDDRRLGAQALGNLELGGAYRAFGQAFGLSLILPAGQGEAPDPTAVFDQNHANAYYANRASALARGFNDFGLFEPRSWGGAITYESQAPYLGERFYADPFLRFETLFDQKSNPQSKTAGALVVGAKVGVHVLDRKIDLGVRAWEGALLWGHKEGAFMIEPGAEANFARLHFRIGVLVPLAGTTAGEWWSLRFLAGFTF